MKVDLSVNLGAKLNCVSVVAPFAAWRATNVTTGLVNWFCNEHASEISLRPLGHLLTCLAKNGAGKVVRKTYGVEHQGCCIQHHGYPRNGQRSPLAMTNYAAE